MVTTEKAPKLQKLKLIPHRQMELKIFHIKFDGKQLAEGMDNTATTTEMMLVGVPFFQQCGCDQPIINQQLPYWLVKELLLAACHC